jgi:hypothetical protein
LIKVVVSAVFSTLILSSCAAPEISSRTIPPSPSPTTQLQNKWLLACENYEIRGDETYHRAYDAIILDYCANSQPESYELDFEASETVDQEDLALHIDSEKFFLSYWSRFMGEVPQKQEFIFTNKDKEWWEEKQVESLTSPDLGWFTSTSEGGHCRVDPFIYCSKLFEPALTVSGAPVEFRIIGTSFRKEYWQLTNMAHETVHLYQDSLGMSHWAPWYVEGQATLFELAAGELLFGNDDLRNEYFTRVARHDRVPFNPESAESVYQHFVSCSQMQQGECDQFFYGAGSLYHEKLIIDHGLDTYFAWQRTLSELMPKGNPGSFSNEQLQLMSTTFRDVFNSTFTYQLNDFETVIAPSYVSEQFSNYSKNSNH